MSDQQKLFASVSGAIAAHLLLLVALMVVLSTGSRGASLQRSEEPIGNQPREVTIMMSELLEEAIIEPPAPLEVLAEKPFITTDLNEREAEKPDQARFESDRNTTAAAEIAPNQELPQEDAPTTVGLAPIERLTLQQRDYQDGELNQPAAAAGGASSPPQPEGEPVPEIAQDSSTDSKSSESPDKGEAPAPVEGVDTPPEQTIAEETTRPVESQTDGEAELTTARKSFVDPDASPFAASLPEMTDQEDQFAKTQEKSEEKVGELADAAKEEIAAASEESTEQLEETQKATPGEINLTQADTSMFAPGYTPEEIQSTINGKQTRVGQNAVDAEETAIGRYKKQIKDAIGQKWHQYRVNHGDFVTWGVLKVECKVNSFGKVYDIEVVKREANTVLVDFSLRAMVDANIPPMPQEVIDELGAGGLDLKYDFIIY